MALTDRTVAIAGGGIGGMATALACVRRGAETHVFERAEALAEVGAGLQLSPNGMKVLDALGVGEAIRAVASTPRAIELRDHRRERLLMRVPLGDAYQARHGAPYLHIHRADLLHVLTEAAEGAGVHLHLGREALGYTPDPTLEFDSGISFPADVVVGADGVHSALRRQSWSGHAPTFTGQVAWRGLVPADRLPPDLIPPATTLLMGPGRHLVLYPLRDRSLVNFVAVEERSDWAEEGWSIPDDPDNLRAAFAGWGPMADGVLGACEQTFLWGLFAHPSLDTWSDGGMVLTGDAAHPMLPFIAQGAVMALEDAWALAASLDTGTVAEGIARYDRQRRERATRVQTTAQGQARLY
ncbi:MAG: FAD-dependent monooxygenase, partial [Pseudomonadota bacterium]